MKLDVDIYKELPGFTLQTSFSIANHTLGILGSSGSGKSMTLRCIAGLDKPDKGKIILNGRILFDSDKKINLPAQQRNIGYLFQNYALFPNMTVAENIGFALRCPSRKDKNKVVQEKINMVKLNGLENRYPSQLSGGQQQRAALARALAINPEIILLDEPFSALDNHLRSEMEKQIIETLADLNVPALFVTHNLEEAYRISDDLIIMADGRIVAHGTKDEVFQRPTTLPAAEITGCKNISKARRLSEDYIEALDWGCQLKIPATEVSPFKYIGIRAEHLSLLDKKDEDNIFPCWLNQVTESPYDVTLYLRLKEECDKQFNNGLQINLTKENFHAIKDKSFPWYIHINSKFIFMME